MVVDLSVDFGKFKIKNPIMTASGTFGYSIEYNVFQEVKDIGSIVTKGVTLEPRLGNEGERVFEVEKGLINRIGLENVGIHAFLKQKKPILEKYGITYILNIAGNSFDDYFELAAICNENKIPAIEVNVSCPNVKSGCLEFGTNPDTLFELISGIRKRYEGFLIVKLTPNVTDIGELAKMSERAGADAISAINTLKGLGLKLNYVGGKFYKTQVQGGLSGKCVKPVALYCIKRIKEVSSIPIIGIGGISTLDDILEFMAMGADSVQIGTENFTTPDICEKLIAELKDFMETNGFKTLEELKKELRK